MSRSRRKTPIVPICTSSPKKWKKGYNKSMRQKKGEENPRKNEYSDEYTGPRDGKRRIGGETDEWAIRALRK